MHKIAIVVQRYGADIVGGAESHARQLAERLVRDLGWQVEVLTTTAKDYRTWANAYPEGMEDLNGVRVRRFASVSGRTLLFPVYHRFLKLCLPLLGRSRLAGALEKLWLILQGPYCPALVQHITDHASQYDRFFFFTYLYYPTVWGHQAVAQKSTLIPTAHDEFPFHFATIRAMLRRVAAIFPNTPAEARLIAGKLGTPAGAPTMQTVGLGIDTTFFRPDPTRKKEGVLYLGRISRGKNVDQMLTWCRTHAPTTPVRLAGKIEDDVTLPASPLVAHLGVVSENEKLTLLQGAQCVINPSEFESLSLIVLEAIACGVPVLVNARCEVLAHYASVCPTVFGYRNEQEFAHALQNILATDWTTPDRQEALATSRRWLETAYSWRQVLATFQASVGIEGTTSN